MDRKPSKIAIVGGCGHVGLPLGIAFALVPNQKVVLVDVSESAVKRVNSGIMGFEEKGGQQRLRQVIGKSLFATTRVEEVRDADGVIFIIGTPVDEHMNPRISDVMRVINEYMPHLVNGQLVVLRSTVFPGVTETIKKFLDKSGRKVDVAFCPERVAQGVAIEEICSLPQIVSGFDRRSEQRAAELFGLLTKDILRMKPLEAELTKLFANSWRYIHFAIANHLYMVAETYGIDYNRIHQALTYKYPRAKDFSRPGLTAGPCLFKDTMQLAAFHRRDVMLGHAAMLVNEGLPNFLVDQMEKKLGTLEDKKIGLLGMAFKANNDDTRESLSYKIKKILESRMAVVLPTDVYQSSSNKLEEILREADGFILGTPHREYLEVDKRGKPYVDCWGFWASRESLDLTKSIFDDEQELIRMGIAG